MKVYIESLGCSKNLVDTENMLGLITDDDYELAENAEEADILIVNTCAFIDDAMTESFEVIDEFSRVFSCKKLIVTGCLAESLKKEISNKFKVDALVGTTGFTQICSVISEVVSPPENKEVLQHFPDINCIIPEGLPRVLTTHPHMAYLKIAEGCDNRCSYCRIPAIRGSYRSRTVEDIVEEARDLVELGVREFILIAQDVSRYGIDTYGKYELIQLLRELNDIPNLRWIRLHYMYPDVVDAELVEEIFKLEHVVNYFDIPIQHASDRVLKRMNRKTCEADIEHLFSLIRTAEKNSNSPAIIRSTAIIGFPGETEADFDCLMSFIHKNPIDRLAFFKYSDLETVPSYKMKNKVDKACLDERFDLIVREQMLITKSLLDKFVGRIISVVIEEHYENENIYIGRSEYDSFEVDGEVILVNCDKNLDFGDFVDVKIVDSLEYDLVGEFYEYCK